MVRPVKIASCRQFPKARTVSMDTTGTQPAPEPPVQPAVVMAHMGATVTIPMARHRSLRRAALPWMQRYGAVAALIILIIIAGILSPNFLSQENIRLQLQTFCLATALIGVGQTLVILTGGIDLAVGSLLAVGSCLAGQMIIQGAPIPLAFAAPILLTTVLGGTSGTIITKARIQPIVV